MKKYYKWVLCPNCQHKLFKVVSGEVDSNIGFEVKCHSCKTISAIAVTVREDGKLVLGSRIVETANTTIPGGRSAQPTADDGRLPDGGREEAQT